MLKPEKWRVVDRLVNMAQKINWDIRQKYGKRSKEWRIANIR